MINNPLPDEIHPQAKRGMKYFNQGEYFEAHEYLELAWMDTQSPERDLYQGILQIGIAYYQIKRVNYRGALKMFRRGQDKLRELPKTMMGIDLDQFRVDAHRAESALRSLGPVRMDRFNQELFNSIPIVNYNL